MTKEQYAQEQDRKREEQLQAETERRKNVTKYEEIKVKTKYLNLRICKISKTDKYIIVDLADGFTMFFDNLDDCQKYVDSRLEIKNIFDPPKVSYLEYKREWRRKKNEKYNAPDNVAKRNAIKAGLKAIDEFYFNGDTRKAEKLKKIFGRKLLAAKDICGSKWEETFNDIDKQLYIYSDDGLQWLYNNDTLKSANIFS